MSDDEAAEPARASRAWMDDHRDTYLRSGGARGHILDLTQVGGYPFTTHCLIRHVGRKTGRKMINPLIYGDIGGEVVIIASKGGYPQHPGWYFNITARETVDLQVATQAFRATWREPSGDERAHVWNFMVEVFPSYADYKTRTDREIPIVMMKPIEEIAVFTPADLDPGVVRQG